jgi:hypothetical protein
VDYPSIAAWGSNVYIAYTNANTGTVKVLVSRDRGISWTTRSMGSTTLRSGVGGKTGLPSVAASGSTVIVAWVSNGSGAVHARVSTNGGSSFGSATLLATSNRSYPSAAALGGRAGIAFIGAEPSFRIWQAGSWGPALTVPFVDHEWLVDLFGPALVLIGSGGVGIAYTGCVQLCDVYRDGSHLETQYVESPDGGVSWYVGFPLSVARGSDGRPAYSGVSAVASSSTRREFTVTGWYPGTTKRRVYHRAFAFPIPPEVAPAGSSSPIDTPGLSSSAPVPVGGVPGRDRVGGQ